MNSHDYRYEDEIGFTYLDSYLGGECFVGEEVAWLHDTPVWSMNYVLRRTRYYTYKFLLS